MSIHPNLLIVLALTPDGLSRKTLRDILAEIPDVSEDSIKIKGRDFSYAVAESDYLEDQQITTREGDLVFWDFLTYGYGETIGWEELEQIGEDLEDWARPICKKHNCIQRIYFTANYW